MSATRPRRDSEPIPIRRSRSTDPVHTKEYAGSFKNEPWDFIAFMEKRHQERAKTTARE